MARWPFFSRGNAQGAEPAAALDDSHDEQPDERHVGFELRRARERMGLPLKTVAGDLNIRAAYLDALERNDRAALPARPYAIGFVRSYAGYVGLDPGDMARRFRAEAGGPPPGQTRAWLKPVERGRLSRSALLLLSLAIAGAAYALWYYRTADERRPAAAMDIAAIAPSRPESGPEPGPDLAQDSGQDSAAPARPDSPISDPTSDPPSDRTAALSATETPAADRPVSAGPAPGGRAPDAVAARPGPDNAAPDNAAPTSADSDAASDDAPTRAVATGNAASGAAASEDAAGGEAARDNASRGDAAPENGAEAAPLPEPAAAARPVMLPVMLRALDRVWVRVRHPASGRVAVEGIMRPGNMLAVPDEAGLVLDVGRANKLEYLVAGKSAGLAGPREAVRHNLPLDPLRLAPRLPAGDPLAPASGSVSGGAPASEPRRHPESGSPSDPQNDPGNDRGAPGSAAATAPDAASEAPAAGQALHLPAFHLRARGLVWIRVHHPQTRQIVLEGILQQGSSVAVPDEPGLVLDVGRANQLEYLIGGRPAGLAGESPGPVRNLPLDPARQRRGG